MNALAKPRPAPETARLGMWIFLATEVLFFGGLLLGYLDARMRWPQGFALASRHTDVVLGTLNTGLLLTSSALVAAAVACAEQHAASRRRGTSRLLVATAVLGVAFIAVKALEYRQEFIEGLLPGPGFALSGTPGAELFFELYFTLTALHAVHLAIGVLVLAVFAYGAHCEREWANARRVDIAALYWHFVDVVWIFLYPLIYLVNRHS